MNLNNFLQEEFTKIAFKDPDYGHYVEVFINPSKKEMDEASIEFKGSKYLRFIADPRGTYLYVFSPKTFHDTVFEKLLNHKGPIYFNRNSKQLWGTAKKVKGQWIFDGSDRGTPENFNWEALKKKGILKGRKHTGPSKLGTDPDEKTINPFDIHNQNKITSKKPNLNKERKKIIKEEFKDAFKHPYNKSTVEIFKNPSKREMVEVASKLNHKIYIRFIANPSTKSIYVFTPEIVHRRVSLVLFKRSSPKPNEIWGVAYRDRNGQWKSENSDILEWVFDKRKHVKAILEADWNWLKKYINVKPFLDKLRKNEKTVSTDLEPVNIARKGTPVRKRKIEETLLLMKEEFATYITKDNESAIFKNPTKKEFREADDDGYVRFILHQNNGKVDCYVFKTGFIHERAAKKLQIKYPLNINIIAGVAVKKNKKWESLATIPNISAIFRIEGKEELKKLLEKNWTNPWIDVSKIITFYKQRIKK